jgi:hypothetical protein
MALAEEFYKKLDYNVKTYGLQVQHVFGDETGPSFSYSIGLFETYKHSEILIIGLSQELCQLIINNMAFDIKNGMVYYPFHFYPDILDNFDCYITSVNKSNLENYVFQAEQYYGNSDFPVIQCIYPTINGIFPWEDAWIDKSKQPILGLINL